MSYRLGNKGAHMVNGNTVTCEDCNKTYVSQKRLENHKCNYCKSCCKIFSSQQKLQNHQCKTDLQCIKCMKIFTKQPRLDKHRCTYCGICRNLFTSYQKLKQHKCKNSRLDGADKSECNIEHLDVKPNTVQNTTIRQSLTQPVSSSGGNNHTQHRFPVFPHAHKSEIRNEHVLPESANTKINAHNPNQTHNVKSYTQTSETHALHTEKDIQQQDLCYQSTEHQSFAFHPLTFEYQKTVARKINLPVMHVHQFYPGTTLDEPTQIQNIRGDGNCFFRCISYLLSGSEEFHQTVRNAVVNHMVSLGSQMSRILQPNTTVQQYL